MCSELECGFSSPRGARFCGGCGKMIHVNQEPVRHDSHGGVSNTNAFSHGTAMRPACTGVSMHEQLTARSAARLSPPHGGVVKTRRESINHNHNHNHDNNHNNNNNHNHNDNHHHNNKASEQKNTAATLSESESRNTNNVHRGSAGVYVLELQQGKWYASSVVLFTSFYAAGV
jgi:hypothetical protein